MSKAEQFIKDYTKECNNELVFGEFQRWLTPEQALAAVEIARDELIDKACNYLFSHSGKVVIFFDNDNVEYIDRSDFIKGFRQAMEK